MGPGTSDWRAYGVALVGPIVAAVLSLPLNRFVDGTVTAVFVAAVTISGWYGGIGPGLLATVLSATLFDYLFINHAFPFTMNPSLSMICLVEFLSVSLLITFLTAKARHLACELDRRATVAETGYREIALLQEISEAVLGTTDLTGLVDRFVAATMSMGRYDVGLLCLVGCDGAIQLMASHGFPQSSNLPPALHHCIRHRVIELKAPLIVEELSVNPEFPGLVREGIRSLVIVPILAAEQPVGTLLMGSRSPRSFTPSDVTTLQAIGGQAGIALQKARLLEETEGTSALLKGTLESTVDGILVVDDQGSILRYNQRFAQMWQLPEAVLAKELSTDARALAREQLVDPEQFDCRVEERRVGPAEELFDVLEFKDGRVFERHSQLLPMKGRQTACVCSFLDVTERREVERRLVQAQRLEATSRIASQVAHDFNNLLSPMVAFPELVKQQLPVGDPTIGFCDIMKEAAEQMAEINEDLMTLGRRAHFEQRSVELNALVSGVLAELGPTPATLMVDRQLAKELLPVSGAPAQLGRMLLNLITNAREAMQETGTITITTENVYLDRPTGSSTRVPIGEYVRLDVADTGPGVAPEVQEHMFEAFFTTKSLGRRRGAGLGLSIVQAVVEDHHGHIDVQTEPFKGTIFSVYLPITRDEVIPTATMEPAGGSESILVIDDDPLQRAVAEEVLGRLGYRVRTAASGEEAVDLVATQSVDLLILDMVMPGGIDGAETYRRIKERSPRQAAILLSGFAESERVLTAQTLGAGAYVRKPATRDRLAAAVRSELDRSRP